MLPNQMPIPTGLAFVGGIARDTNGRFYFRCTRKPHRSFYRTFKSREDVETFRTEHINQHIRRDPFGRGRAPYRSTPRNLGRLNTTAIGGRAELLVAADLLADGWEVWRTVAHGCDLVARRGADVRFIEVKTCPRVRADGSPTLSNWRIDKCTHLAIVTQGEIRYYSIEEYRAARRQCNRGHLLTGDTIVSRDGRDHCRKCDAMVHEAAAAREEFKTEYKSKKAEWREREKMWKMLDRLAEEIPE